MPEERKLATILFADIVQSSEVAQAHDPEVLRRTLGDVFGRMRDVLQSFGATVEKFIGDAVMAVFGVPIAHDDDAERAVRAALALLDAVAGMARPLALELRIGINSGEIVTGDLRDAPTLVTGSPVIVAARLQQSAAPGEILVGELTRRLTADRVSYRPARSIVGKGIGPIQAAAVEGLRSAAPTRHMSPLIGRRRELATLHRHREEARLSRSVRVVMVLGPAGIGKSRLTEEFARQVAPAPILRGHCLPYGQGITLWPLQEIVRESAGITPTDDPKTAGARVAAAVAEVLGTGGGDAVADRLAALVAAAAEAADHSPEDVQRGITWALARYLEGLAAHSAGAPVVLLEDLHLAEPALLSILQDLAGNAHAPVLMVGLARSEFAERHPSWLRGSSMAVLGLDPLTKTQSERLAGALLEGYGVPSETVSAIVSRAEGNPLYLEELAQVVREHGDPATVPPTLTALIAARLDALDPDMKRFAQRASILGRDFWLDALTDGEREPLVRVAAEAERRHLVTVLDRTGPSGTATYRFRHLLIRDVAYASSPKAERMRLHDHYARWLRAAAGDRIREYIEVVAYHAEQAWSAARQIEAPLVADLGRQAFDALVESATAARDRADFRAALAIADRALDVAKSAPVPRAARTKALGLAAIMRLRLEPSREALQLLERAIDEARAEGPSEHLVRMLVWRAQVALAEDVVAARRLFDEMVNAARSLGDDELITYALWVSGQPSETVGALRDQSRVLHEARALMVRTGADRWLVDALVDLSGNSLHLGEVNTAAALAAEAAAIARERGTRLQRYKAEIAVARVRFAEGDLDGALRDAGAAFALSRELGGPWALAEGAEILGELHLARVDAPAALRVLEACSGQLDPAKMPAMRGRIARVRALLARAYLAAGNVDRAREAATAARAAAPRPDVRASALAAAALAHVETAAGRPREAKRLMDEALAIIEPTDYRMLAARLVSERASLLTTGAVRRLTV